MFFSPVCGKKTFDFSIGNHALIFKCDIFYDRISYQYRIKVVHLKVNLLIFVIVFILMVSLFLIFFSFCLNSVKANRNDLKCFQIINVSMNINTENGAQMFSTFKKKKNCS